MADRTSADSEQDPGQPAITERCVVREELTQAVHLAFTVGTSDAVTLVLASAACEIPQALSARAGYKTLKSKLGEKVVKFDGRSSLHT